MSTDDQQTIDDYNTPTESPGYTTSDWNPPTSHDRRCLGCGAQITKKFERTCGDRNGDVHGCLDCINQNAMPEAAANPQLANQARKELPEHRKTGSAGGRPGAHR